MKKDVNDNNSHLFVLTVVY